MAVRVEQMTSEVAVFDGEVPLSEAQLEKVARLVMRRIDAMQRSQKWSREATQLRRSVAPKLDIEG
ncbi:MAG: hypothetical protein L0227_15180 [Chloroflexi bacterium]|nr:hypothetical protein [Chloroflexota bacterium]